MVGVPARPLKIGPTQFFKKSFIFIVFFKNVLIISCNFKTWKKSELVAQNPIEQTIVNIITFVTLFPSMPVIKTKHKNTFNMTGLEINGKLFKIYVLNTWMH